MGFFIAILCDLSFSEHLCIELSLGFTLKLKICLRLSSLSFRFPIELIHYVFLCFLRKKDQIFIFHGI